MQQIRITTVANSLIALPKNETLIIASKTALSKLSCKDTFNKKLVGSFPILFCKSPETFYSSVYNTIGNYKIIVGIGGGTVIDYAKYTAKHKNCKCIAIPSMLSTNAFATNKVAVVANNSKHTELGILPNEVIVDTQYLSQSPVENYYGLADVFSIYNALRDWKLSDEPIIPNIWNRAMVLLDKAVTIMRNMSHPSVTEYNLAKAFDIILDSGYITNDYGSGRPESGSEHIFASALESQMAIPHALSVTLGIHIMEFLSKYVDSYPVYDFKKIPFKPLIKKINTRHLHWKTISNIVVNLQPRHDKYTLINLLKPVTANTSVMNDLFTFLKECGFKFK